MIDWKSDDVIKHFANLFPETGEEDAALVLGMSARSFLPESVGKNEIARQKELDIQVEIQKLIDNIGDTVVDEAFDIIDKQEAFFD